MVKTIHTATESNYQYPSRLQVQRLLVAYWGLIISYAIAIHLGLLWSLTEYLIDSFLSGALTLLLALQRFAFGLYRPLLDWIINYPA